MSTAFARALPELAARIASVPLGHWPTPIAPVEVDGRTLWFKCEGDSHPLYGGNKLRTLEVWLGHARERGAKRIWAIGAYGSNHAIATVLHARTAGLEAGAMIFPQPASEWAIENCAALVTSGCPLIRLRSVIEVPFARLRVPRGDLVMPPGGATTIGTFGAVAAALSPPSRSPPACCHLRRGSSSRSARRARPPACSRASRSRTRSACGAGRCRSSTACA